MDTSFLVAWFTRPPVVLGRQLLPLSCGHCAILDGMGSPLVTGGGKFSAEDLIQAAWVCSRDFDTSRRELHEDQERMADARKWGASVADADLQKEMEVFLDYFAAYMKAPPRWKTDGTKKAKAPWYLVIATTLMRELKWSEARAWNASLPEALWYFAAIAEQNGDDSLISEEERAKLAAIREMERMMKEAKP